MYIDVADADLTLVRITAAGGTILTAPAGVSTAGGEAVLTDHCGVRFAVWPAGQSPEVGRPLVGRDEPSGAARSCVCECRRWRMSTRFPSRINGRWVA